MNEIELTVQKLKTIVGSESKTNELLQELNSVLLTGMHPDRIISLLHFITTKGEV